MWIFVHLSQTVIMVRAESTSEVITQVKLWEINQITYQTQQKHCNTSFGISPNMNSRKTL